MILTKLVTHAVSSYTMVMFKLLKTMCNVLDGITKRFWWDGRTKNHIYLALCSWKDLCRPKELGGLGFRSFQD